MKVAEESRTQSSRCSIFFTPLTYTVTRLTSPPFILVHCSRRYPPIGRLAVLVRRLPH